MAVLPSLLRQGLRVIDLSADYRLRDPNVYAQWYGASHEDVAHLTQAVYGLPELYGEEIASAQLLANPGCYPQTGILGLAPLAAGGYLEPRGVIIDSKSGVSGAGRTPETDVSLPRVQRERRRLRHRQPPPHAGDRAGADRRGRRTDGGAVHAAPDPDGPRHLLHHLRDAAPAPVGGRTARPLPRLLRPRPVRARRGPASGHEGLRGDQLLRRDGARGPRAASWCWAAWTTWSAAPAAWPFRTST